MMATTHAGTAIPTVRRGGQTSSETSAHTPAAARGRAYFGSELQFGRVPRVCEHGEQVSIHIFVYALLGGSAALALWILARYSNFGPRTLIWAIVHAIAAMALLRFVSVPLGLINASGVPAARFLCAFGVALPLFIYAFLSGGWVTRVALGLLHP